MTDIGLWIARLWLSGMIVAIVFAFYTVITGGK